MIEEHAVVVKIDVDCVWIETQRKSTCGQCAAKSGCGTAILSKVLGQKTNRISVAQSLPVQVGDQVVIGIEENALVRGSMAVYAVPLLAMIMFGLLGETVSQQVLKVPNDSISIIGALIGLFIGMVWMRLFAVRVRNDVNYQPRILRIGNQIKVA